MRGDTLGGGEGCMASPPGIVDRTGTEGYVDAGGGVRGRVRRGSCCCCCWCCNASEMAARAWDEGSWIGEISDVRTLTPGRKATGASASESPSSAAATAAATNA